MAALFTPLKLRDITLKNRIAVSPMCQYSSINGYSNNWHLVHLGSRATGGAGLIITEATAISPEGRISAADLGIWEDGHIEGLRQITSFLEENGSVPGIQLAHAGRKAAVKPPFMGGGKAEGDLTWPTVAPSPIPFYEGTTPPLEMTEADIEKVITDFETATHRALEAGFKVAEIHAAHGYLLNEFLSPLTNQRQDQYGGSFENRARLLLTITKRLRAIWPQGYPLFVRISAIDWAEGGFTVEDSIKLAILLKEAGVDLIDTSTGGNVAHQKITVAPGYQVPFAEAVKKGAGIPTGAVGLITNTHQAEDIIAGKQADLVLLARESLRDPNFPLRAARELGVNVEWPLQYQRAKL